MNSLCGEKSPPRPQELVCSLQDPQDRILGRRRGDMCLVIAVGG